MDIETSDTGRRQGWRRPQLKLTALHEELVARVRDMIVEGELPPGMRIPERDLCEHFGVSRTPLREALKVLASEGFVTLSPNRGATVTAPTVEMISQRFEVIAALESSAARLVCEHGSDALLSELKALHEKMNRLHGGHDLASYFAANQQFHETLVRECGNTILAEIHAQNAIHLRRLRFQSILFGNQSKHFLRQHERVMRALLARDSRRAQTAIQAHNRSLLDCVRNALLQAMIPQQLPDAQTSAQPSGSVPLT